MIETGTRTRQLPLHTRAPQGDLTRSFTRDVGMSKLASGSFTFGSNEVSGANGTFAAFALNDVLLVEGTNQNNGNFTVIGLDSVNQAYLTLDPPPAAEGPVTSTVRTS